MAARILIVDDERGVRDSLQAILGDEGFTADAVATGEECLARLESDDYDVVLLDVWLPRMDGLDVLAVISERPASPSVVIISGHGSIDTAVRATRLGAFDFIEKPLSLDKTLLVVQNALKQRKLLDQNRTLRQQIAGEAQLIGRSTALESLRQEIAAAAQSTARVLLRGENGTGKKLVARVLHHSSPRADEPFVEIHCAAVPEELLASELFGRARGGLGAAGESIRGKFELAHGGTLLLDEVADLPLPIQDQLLRVLEEGAVEPIGGSEKRPVDVRLLAATSRDLDEVMARDAFREDLFFRLNAISLQVPALRERRADISPLVAHFLEVFRRRHGRGPREFEAAALEALQSYSWPGNVRELRNLVERMAIMVPREQVVARDLPGLYRGTGASEDPFAPHHSLREGREVFERLFIRRRLAEHGNNITRTAEALGVERSHLHRKIKALGL